MDAEVIAIGLKRTATPEDVARLDPREKASYDLIAAEEALVDAARAMCTAAAEIEELSEGEVRVQTRHLEAARSIVGLASTNITPRA